MAQTAEVFETIQLFLKRVKRDSEVDASTSLFGDGVALDSLETAELSAMLEDEHGEDPFSQGGLPQTIGEVLAFYEPAA